MKYLYILFWNIFVFAGAGYVVFWKGATPLWFLLAILVAVSPKDN